MQIGKLRHRVTFLLPNPTPDSMGSPGADIEGATTWARIRFVSGVERFQSMAFTASVTHCITMRWRPGVSSNQKIRYEQRTFQILYANDVEERRIQLDIYCVELNDGGQQAC